MISKLITRMITSDTRLELFSIKDEEFIYGGGGGGGEYILILRK